MLLRNSEAILHLTSLKIFSNNSFDLDVADLWSPSALLGSISDIQPIIRKHLFVEIFHIVLDIC